jgi:cellulose synthase/poly-beta-1,6-N-acetylglucosamine synthase-like glycosyltransferase
MQITNKRVSFLIPFANIASEIDQTLNSIFKIKGIKNFEVILLNMTNRKFSKRENLFIHSHKKLKRSLARNLTAELSSGEILVFMDDNTIIHQDFYLNILKNNKTEEQKFDALQGTIFLSPKKTNYSFLSLFYEYKNATNGTFNVSQNGLIDTALFIIPKVIFNDLNGFCHWLNRFEDREFSIRFNRKYKMGPLNNTHAIKLISPIYYRNLLSRRVHENFDKVKCNLYYKGLKEVIKIEYTLLKNNYLSKERLRFIRQKEGFILYLMNSSIFLIWLFIFPIVVIYCLSYFLFSNTNTAS